MAYDDETLEYVFAKTGGRCRYCKKQLSFSNYGQTRRRGAWVVDHANPVSRGGTDYLRNLWPACVDCNLDKSDRTAQSYSRSLEPRPASAECFVATAAFGTPWAREIDSLRQLRDRILLRTHMGRAFVRTYYQASPEVARWVVRSPRFATAVRPPLRALSRVAAKILGESAAPSPPTGNVTYSSARDPRGRDSS